MNEAIEIDDRLQAYFDDELEEGERAALAARLAASPELGQRLEDLRFMREIVVGSLDKQAERIHEARFEQIWEEIDRTLDREERLQHAVDEPPSLLSRLAALFRSVRMPLATAAVAATVAVVVVAVTADGDGQNNGAVAASDPSEEPAVEAKVPTDSGSPAARPPAPDRLASAEPAKSEPEPVEEIFSQPESNDAEIETIEFGGQSGSIAHIEGARGTTTVIWVVEDEDPVDSERSL